MLSLPGRPDTFAYKDLIKLVLTTLKLKRMKKRVTFLIVLLMVSIFHIYAQQQNISGTVIDKNLNEPVIGASIQIKGTTNGTITDLDGKFSINASKDDILVISYIGYTTQEIKLTGQSSLKIEFHG